MQNNIGTPLPDGWWNWPLESYSDTLVLIQKPEGGCFWCPTKFWKQKRREAHEAPIKAAKLATKAVLAAEKQAKREQRQIQQSTEKQKKLEWHADVQKRQAAKAALTAERQQWHADVQARKTQEAAEKQIKREQRILRKAQEAAEKQARTEQNATAEVTRTQRNNSICKAYRSGLYTQAQLSQASGLSLPMIARILAGIEPLAREAN